ncbi:hypothetical protein MGL_2362 [Malassezia globosa CBS 7966]|uniref:IMS import disulfide relay-system CHCH-CHCH-like Cx9C domain-containing protein n=1 Tax=Malassezia globosa (strain ATCC MYA-4612 / CBS 7966) TaxID=425265 RepID=A8Q3C8_MALGO|nr:uncharacterized protein MGL_2362 [Malassezia globosa CBS 7966]EDP43352.1 hypothetical protein MGL_2362 [Malassezia globosa CBS 7966]
MEPLMESVGKQCQDQLAVFQRCIYVHRNDPASCTQPQQELAKCASNAVPMLQTIKRTCGHLIREYDQCLAANKDASSDELAVQCTSKLRALAECAEAVKLNSQTA